MDKQVLQISNLSIKTGTENDILNLTTNISLAIHRNSTHALVGESGSGKSLTALAIMQLLPENIYITNQSAIYINGNDCSRLAEKQMRALRRNKIGFIFQDAMSAFNPVKTIYQQISERLHSKKNSQQIVYDLLKDVGIKEIQRCSKAYPHQLSGGQRQRAMIAMALANKPELLIADEPTTALDVTVQQQIIQLLKHCQQKNNMAMLFITHDLALVKQLADQITVLQQGRVVEQSSAAEFFEAPQHAYSKMLLQACPDLTAKCATQASSEVLATNNITVKFKTGPWWQKIILKQL